MVPRPKRPRACDACHSIKIKCDLGTTGGPGPCERCLRLGKECVVTPPKRQKDRVAELEAQVAALTKLLQSQNIDSPNSEISAFAQSSSGAKDSPGLEYTASQSIRDATLPMKRRRLEVESDDSNETGSTECASEVIGLDSLVSKDLQRRVFEAYREVVMNTSPLVPIPKDWSYERLRGSKPILLQAIIYAASPGLLPVETQEDIAQYIMKMFASLAIAEGKKSIELVQAIQVGALWYRSPRNHRHVAAFQLIQLASGIAEDIGLGGPQCSPSLGYIDNGQIVDASEAMRTWLVCQLLSAAMTVLMRRPSAHTWSDHEDTGIHFLDYMEQSLASDRLLCQCVRAERLCEQIALQLNFCDFTQTIDVSDPTVQAKMQGLQNSFADWKAYIPPTLRCLSFTFWEHAITLYLHETVLHTPTNKQSFAAPYLAERLSITDFPTPIVMPEHIASIHALKNAGHALMDLFATIDTITLVTLPSFFFGPRIAYAQYIFVKLYIAATAPGNTFSAFFDPESLQIESYLDKMIELGRTVRKIDDRCSPARLLMAAIRLKEWFLNYKNLNVNGQFILSAADTGKSLHGQVTNQDMLMSWSDPTFGDETLSVGLDDIFADGSFEDLFAQSSEYGAFPPLGIAT